MDKVHHGDTARKPQTLIWSLNKYFKKIAEASYITCSLWRLNTSLTGATINAPVFSVIKSIEVFLAAFCNLRVLWGAETHSFRNKQQKGDPGKTTTTWPTLFSIHKMWDRIWFIIFDPWGVPGSTKTWSTVRKSRYMSKKNFYIFMSANRKITLNFQEVEKRQRGAYF